MQSAYSCRYLLVSGLKKSAGRISNKVFMTIIILPSCRLTLLPIISLTIARTSGQLYLKYIAYATTLIGVASFATFFAIYYLLQQIPTQFLQIIICYQKNNPLSYKLISYLFYTRKSWSTQLLHRIEQLFYSILHAISLYQLYNLLISRYPVIILFIINRKKIHLRIIPNCIIYNAIPIRLTRSGICIS